MSATAFEEATTAAITKLVAKALQLEDALIVERQMVDVLFAASHTRMAVTDVLKVAQLAIEEAAEEGPRGAAKKEVYRKRIAQILDSNKTTGGPSFKLDPDITIN